MARKLKSRFQSQSAEQRLLQWRDVILVNESSWPATALEYVKSAECNSKQVTGKVNDVRSKLKIDRSVDETT